MYLKSTGTFHKHILKEGAYPKQCIWMTTIYSGGSQALNRWLPSIRIITVYIAYRKAGYSKKFRAEHEADILIHQAAKKYFDSLGVEKLPTVKTLREEYAEVLEAKRKAYAEYKQVREEMRELQNVKANIDYLLGPSAERTQEKEHS